MNKTIHVVPSGKGWTVRRQGNSKTGPLYATQRDALAEARSLLRKSDSGQVVIHGRGGRLIAAGVHGLPKIQKPPVKSSLGSKNIQRAISQIVLDRIASA